MECRDSNQVNWVPCNPIENSHLKERRKTVIKALSYADHRLKKHQKYKGKNTNGM